MALPVPGDPSTNGTWGTDLNNWLNDLQARVVSAEAAVANRPAVLVLGATDPIPEGTAGGTLVARVQ